MDITGHFESASCVIEVDGSDTLAQVKVKLLAELGVPRARHVGMRMKGGVDIGNDDLRICDTVIDEGCAVELYCTGTNITPGVIQGLSDAFRLTLSPCERHLAVLCENEVFIFHTETHECLCRFMWYTFCAPAFSPCGEWISSINKDTQCAEVHDVKTGAVKHSFGDEGDERWATAWSPCGTQLLSCCVKGLQVWDIATGVIVHEWDHILECMHGMVVTGDRVAMFGRRSKSITFWDYTTGVEVFVLTCPSDVYYVTLSPNERFIAACYEDGVRVWNIQTRESVFDSSDDELTDVAVSNDIVAVSSSTTWYTWPISPGGEPFQREYDGCDSCGLAISSCGGVVMCAGTDGVEIVDISHLS